MGGGKGGGAAPPPQPRAPKPGVQIDGSKITRNADGTYSYGDVTGTSRQDLIAQVTRNKTTARDDAVRQRQLALQAARRRRGGDGHDSGDRSR